MNSVQTMTIRSAGERGQADFGWLKSAHTFSFGSYHDAQHMHYGVLRVINDDQVEGGGGFPAHSHQDAEIFSYVLEGALEHKDSMGNGSTVSQGGVQYMSAGSGVTHSEFNPSDTDRMRFLQVWLIPSENGVTPRYDTLDLTAEEKRGRLKLFLTPDGRDGSIQIRANANVYAAELTGQERIEHDLGEVPKAWIQVARGELNLNGQRITYGDGVAIDGGGTLVFEDGTDAEFLLFELL
ncbi:MAG: pirin family protein [Gammaproteobacteria bacterium]|nr:pirin family protein [Gammaproteobacteria bacterium]